MTRPTRGSLTALAATLGVLLLAALTLAGPASAAPYPPQNPPSLSASAYDPCSGASNIIGGTGYQPGETVVLDLAQTGQVGQATVRADGTFQVTITIPLSERGSDQLTARGTTSGTAVTIRFQFPCVLGQSVSRSAGGGLASTGVAVGAFMAAGALLLGSGTALAVAGRRRRNPATAR